MVNRTVTYLECAFLSQDVYKKQNTNSKRTLSGWLTIYEHNKQHINHKLLHLKLDTIAKKFELEKPLYEKPEPTKEEKQNYHAEQMDTFFGRLYLKKSTNEAVAAIRGTQKLNDLISDVKLTFNQESSHTAFARKFYREVMSFLGNRTTISQFPLFTGHSLGGYLAQLIAVEFNVPAIVFNAPKISGFNDLYLHRRISPNEKHDNIINIDVDYDYIHRVGKPVGSSYIIHGDDECNPHAINTSLLGHAMHNVHSDNNLFTSTDNELENLIVKSLDCQLKEHSVEGVIQALSRDSAFANTVPFHSV